MHSFRRRKRATATLPEISLVPLIDTALTLLVIFMITTPMMQNSIKINLPEGQAQEAKDTQQELVVYINAERHMFINGIPISKQNLIKELKKRITQPNQTVFVKADQTASYGDIINIVDQIKIVGGIKYVALATQKPA